MKINNRQEIKIIKNMFYIPVQINLTRCYALKGQLKVNGPYGFGAFMKE